MVKSFAKCSAPANPMPTPDTPRRPKGRADLVFRELDREFVLYDPTTRDLHVLNPSAAAVWLECTGEATLAEIAAAVAGVFEEPVPLDRLVADVEAAVAQFAEKGLLE